MKCTDSQDVLKETNAQKTGKEPVRNIERLLDPSSHFLAGENSETKPDTPEVG